MNDELNKLNAKWLYGIFIVIAVFALINFISYGCPTIYDNVTDYKIVYDSVIVRAETSVNRLETMAFGPEDVRYTNDKQTKVYVHKCLFFKDRIVCLPKDEYNAYKDMLFGD